MPTSESVVAARFTPAHSIPWLLVGLSCEGWAVYTWIASPSLATPTLLQCFLHSIGSLLLAEGLRLTLPACYQRPAPGIVLLFFLLLWLLPGLALIGLLFALIPALYVATPQAATHWQVLELPPLPYQPFPPPDANAPAMREGLASVLSFAVSPVHRQEAILACRHLPPRQAIGMLRLGLSDPTDDVRLLAYSMLSGIERGLDERIQRLSHKRAQSGDPFGHHAEALAMLNWEYGYLNLAQGNTAHFYLTQALHEIDLAIQHASTAHRQLLRGRLCLALKDYNGAQTAFSQCERQGMHDNDLAPYRAELAFYTHHYATVRDHLLRLTPEAQQQPLLNPIMEYWR